MSNRLIRNFPWRKLFWSGAASFCFIANVAAAVECVPNGDTPVCFSESGFAAMSWDAAEGAVAYYEIFVARDQGNFVAEEITDGAETQVILAGAPNQVVQVRVRACDSTQNCGDLSEPSDGIQFQARPAKLGTSTDTDFTGDGYPDLIWQNQTTGELALWEVERGATQDRGAIAHGLGAGWKAVAHIDFNRDGYADLFWRNDATGENRISLMQNAAVLGWMSAPSQASGWVLASAGDYSGDGYTDLFWRHTTSGANLIWHMQQNQILRTQSLPTLKNSLWTDRAASGDLNGDGYCDLIVQQKAKSLAMAILLKANGTTAFTLPSRPANTWSLLAAHDLTGDGNAELIWSSNSGPMEIWALSLPSGSAFGKTLWRKTLPAYAGTTTIRSVGDYDGDGLLELVLGDASSGAHYFYQLSAAVDAAGSSTITSTPNPAWSVPRLQ